MDPRKIYDFVEGSRLKPEWKGKEIPVTPEKVRSRLRLPARFQHVTLAAPLASTYDAKLYAAAAAYLKEWPVLQSRGRAPLFAGTMSADPSLVAAALSNEIVLRSQANATGDVSMSWLSCTYVLRMITDAKDLERSEMYYELRGQMFRNDLVVVDDLLGAAEVPGGIQFIHTLYGYRYDHNLPTITTVITANGRYSAEIQRMYGKNFLDRIMAMSRGFLVRGKVEE